MRWIAGRGDLCRLDHSRSLVNRAPAASTCQSRGRAVGGAPLPWRLGSTPSPAPQRRLVALCSLTPPPGRRFLPGAERRAPPAERRVFPRRRPELRPPRAPPAAPPGCPAAAQSEDAAALADAAVLRAALGAGHRLLHVLGGRLRAGRGRGRRRQEGECREACAPTRACGWESSCTESAPQLGTAASGTLAGTRSSSFLRALRPAARAPALSGSRGALGAATCLPHAGRGHPEPRTALRQDLGGCYLAGDTALHSLCCWDRRDNPPSGLSAPCSILRPAHPGAPLPALGSWGSLSPGTRCSPSHVPPSWNPRPSRLVPRSWGSWSGWNPGVPAIRGMILPDPPYPAVRTFRDPTRPSFPLTCYAAHFGPGPSRRRDLSSLLRLHFLAPSPSSVCVSDGFGGEAVGTTGRVELTGSD